MPPRLTQAVKDEFAIRYLQQIGANSTPENIAMVLQHLPLEQCAVSAAWKSRGSLSDVLAIDLNPKSLTQAGESPVKLEERLAVKPSGTGMTPIAALLSPRRQLRGQHSFQIGTVCFTFDDMKRKFLLPFKLATIPPEPDVLQLYGTRLETDTNLVGTLSPNQVEQHDAAPGSPPALGSIAKWEAQRRLKSVDERSVPPNASAETVSEMHIEFYLALPLASLGLSKVNEDTRTVLYEALLCPAMIELVQSTVQYLFLTAIYPQSTTREKRHTSTEQDTLFVSIAQRFALLRAKMERKQRSTRRSQLTVLVPLLLLALRVDIETLVRLQYPISFSCAAKEMTQLLQVIDARITQLLDPDSNWSRLAVLETAHEAGQARASSTFQRARRHRRLRDQFFQTSAVLHGLFPDPSSCKSRRVMAMRGGAGVSRYPDLSSDRPEVVPTAKQEEHRLPDVSVASKLSLLRSLRRSQQT
ncbi:hypothetical protein JG687_00000266 [Phytophthora cactorum]|uniref:Uncharacterized protein n=1 Tax=Phytophthora cactorum TaxID=29920 RepID=A0A8T1V415_9STRA|nr:hypothetical protein PC120_g9123 [Phytophthora cactorum]KAG3105178.1 hypothetical protein PC121_g429 [Phytophthora cactorum]KAG3207370.1 hypothetical protein PC128_g139 [Phytophthora cactorum]KAG4055795.1 hypothetical protein PC123_g9099 [Phytophthora cactorum]KAG6974538.1 hypothetical protein JG687_00000266 [Phytophthora cactorum]